MSLSAIVDGTTDGRARTLSKEGVTQATSANQEYNVEIRPPWDRVIILTRQARVV